VAGVLKEILDTVPIPQVPVFRPGA
jgi:hypothetical protein